MQAFKEHFAQLWFYSVAGKALGEILLRKEVALFTVSQMKAFEWLIDSYELANKQKQYKDPLRKKESHCQWILE